MANRRGLLLALCILLPTAAHAAERSTVALALGGGASRGFAHIGALKWLEEHRIPVDAIAGTSIGALVGGAYAAGLSAAEIEDVVDTKTLLRTFDWDDPHAARDYRDKVTTRAMPGAALLPIVGNPPAGLNAGHQLWMLFSRMTFPVSDIENFDALPIPFRTIAVDLLTVEERVFADGNLATAMRASMSVPLLFHPPEADGTLYIDGGALNTVPADVARDLGTDVVIAIDVSPGLKSRDQFVGPGGVLGQAATAPVRANIRRTRDAADVFIRPAVDDFEPGDFEEFATLIQIGYDAMAAHADELAPLGVSEADYAAWKDARAARRARQSIDVIDFVEAANDDPYRQARIEDVLADLVGRPLDFDALESRLTRLKAQGDFYALYYERAARGDQEGLRILSYDRDQPMVALAQLDLHATEIDAFDLGLNLRYTEYGIVGRASEWMTDVRLGARFDASSELYAPVAGPTFLSFRAGFAQRERPVFVGDDRIGDLQRRRLIGGVDLGLGAGWRTQEWRAGVVFDREGIDDAPGDVGEGVTNGATARLRFGFDMTDAETTPTRGVRGFVEARHGFHRSFGDDEVNQVEARGAAWIPVGRHALVARVEAGATLDRDAPARETFDLGGPFRLGALQVERLRGSNYEFAALGWQHALSAAGRFWASRVLLMVEAGGVHADGVDPVVRANVSANYLAETPVGNLIVGVAGSEDDVRGYVTFGRVLY